MTTIAVTGGTGSAGRGVGPFVIAALRAQGHRVVNLDIAVPAEPTRDFRRVDLMNYGDTFAALHDVDAVVHLAAQVDPEFDHLAGAARFHTNTLAAYNVFQAATTLGMARVVWASSETVLGFPFDENPPTALPVRDDGPVRPRLSYAFSKAVTEDLARYMHDRFGTIFVGLRLSHVFYDRPGHPTGYDTLPRYWADPRLRAANLWAYVDARDVAHAVVRSIAAPVEGAQTMIIAAADTLMPQSNADLLAAVFPHARLDPALAPRETLLSIAKARKLIGYRPSYGWRSARTLDRALIPGAPQ